MARLLADALRPGDVVLLEGALGSGKTFLVRAIARELGVPTNVKITSPTFALVHELAGRMRIVHADLYRLHDASELRELGLIDTNAGDALTLIEWGARFQDSLASDGLLIALRDGEGGRHASITSLGARGDERIAALAAVSGVW